jgi:hypothetical protein
MMEGQILQINLEAVNGKVQMMMEAALQILGKALKFAGMGKMIMTMI